MKQIKITLIVLGATLLIAACSNDNLQSSQEQSKSIDRAHLTAFTTGGKTRTTADYDGTGISFYWTKDDHLWVNKNTNPMLPADLEHDADNEINDSITGTVTKVATSRFYFNGTFTEPEYIVRYTGKNGKKDKVTIATTQAQPNFNNATHLGESGDCGIGKATRYGGKYYFTLQHKAAYLTFIPHTSLWYAAARLTQVKVTAEKAIAGEFNFTDTGIDLASRPAATPANQSITLTLSAPPAYGRIANPCRQQGAYHGSGARHLQQADGGIQPLRSVYQANRRHQERICQRNPYARQEPKDNPRPRAAHLSPALRHMGSIARRCGQHQPSHVVYP